MIPYLDNGNKDAFIVLVDFGMLAVQNPDSVQYRDEAWMRSCFEALWNMIAPVGVVRCMTHYPDEKQFGRYILPGEYLRVSVVPEFHWAPPFPDGTQPAGYTPQPIDRWMHWWQTPETFVQVANSGSVPHNIIHEMGHAIFTSKTGPPANPMHTDEAGTVFLAPPPTNATINVPVVNKLWGEQLWYYQNGYRLDDKGHEVKLTRPVN